jgi:hypothetical protein
MWQAQVVNIRLRTSISRAFLDDRATTNVSHGGLALFVVEFLSKRSLS